MTEEEASADFLMLIVLAALTDLSISQQAFTIGVVGMSSEMVVAAIESAANRATAETQRQLDEWRREHGKQMDS